MWMKMKMISNREVIVRSFIAIKVPGQDPLFMK